MPFTAVAAAKLLQSCPTLSDPMDCSPPGSSVHGIFQALEVECQGLLQYATNSMVQIIIIIIEDFTNA